MKLAALLAAVLAAAGLASTARADGDPASDYLLAQRVFLPYDAKFPAKRQAEFTGLVAAANKAGFTIRVAVIFSSYDMGAVTSLWGKPRTYARFLGLELGYVYKQRLLVVMQNGFGFNWPKHPSAAEYAVLAKISPIKPDPAGLLDAAGTAVQRLAAASGVKVAPPAPAQVSTSPSRRNAGDRLIIVLAALGGLALAVLARYFLRRKS